MTIKELRDLISRYDEDDTVEFKVQDSFSSYGENASPKIGSMLEEKWWGTNSGESVTLTLNLERKDNKNSKITYRK